MRKEAQEPNRSIFHLGGNRFFVLAALRKRTPQRHWCALVLWTQPRRHAVLYAHVVFAVIDVPCGCQPLSPVGIEKSGRVGSRILVFAFVCVVQSIVRLPRNDKLLRQFSPSKMGLLLVLARHLVAVSWKRECRE